MNVKNQRKMALSIRNKLLISFIAILIIPTLTVGSMAYFKASSEIKKTTLDGATENIKVLDQIVNDSLKPKMNDVAYFANKYDKDSYTGLEKDKTMAAFKEYYALHPEIVSIFVGSENGDMLQAPQKKFDPGYDPRKRPWYTFATENQGKTVITEPYVSASSGKTLVTVVRTVKDGSGVVAIDISLDGIKASTDSIKVGEKGYSFIVTNQGQYIVHPTEKAGDKSSVFTSSLLAKSEAVHSYTFKETEKQLTFVTNELTGWKIAGTMNVEEATQKAEPILFTTLVMISIFIIIGILVSYVIVLSITKPLKKLVLLTEKVSDGDLTQEFEIKNNDEIGQLGESFNKMILSLRDIIHHVSEKSAQLAAASEQLNASSEQNNSATEQVAHAIQQVAAGMDKQTDMSMDSTQTVREMSAGIQSIMENAQNVSKTSVEAAEAVSGGEGAITLSIQQMENINESVNDLGSVINTLGERSKEISQIINVISDIAGQTNLLALNAAIEAARAGEQGKGFAVVADEVRKLAEQSAKSTETIRNLIGSIQSDTTSAVQAMDKGTKAVERGIDIVNEAGTSFKKIQEFVDIVTSQIQEVSASVQQMNHGVENVVEIVSEIEEIAKTSSKESQEVSAATEEQLASMQEIAASATSLSFMAEELQESVGKFRI
jgi:methyl-accepting chemotaxis protein